MYDFLFVKAIQSKKGKFYVVGHISEKDMADYDLNLAWIEVTESQFETIKDDWTASDVYEVNGRLGAGMRPVFSL